MTRLRQYRTLLALLLGTYLLSTHAQARSRWRTAPTKQVKQWLKSLKPKRLALVIGIKQYADPYWQGLKYPVQDAHHMARALKRDGSFDRVLQRTSKAQTTTQALKRAIQSLKRLNQHPQDTIVVYVSAHGTLSQQNGQGPFRRYVITSDTTKHIPASALPVAWLRRQLKGLKARAKLLILATCYSGDPRSKSRRPKGHKGKLIVPRVAYSKALLILSASSRGQPAYESDKLKGDIYTSFFLQCMQRQTARYRRCQKQKAQRCTPILATKVHACAVHKTSAYAMQHFGQRQLPGLESHIDGIGQIVLAGPKVNPTKDKPIRISMGTVQILPTLHKRYELRIVRKGTKGSSQPTSQRQLVFLRPGTYTVQAISRKHRRTLTRRVQISPGQRLLLRLPPTPWTPADKRPLQALPRSMKLTKNDAKKRTVVLSLIESHVQRKLGPFYRVAGVTLAWKKRLRSGQTIYPTAVAFALYDALGPSALAHRVASRKLVRLQRISHWQRFAHLGKAHAAWQQLPSRWQAKLPETIMCRTVDLHRKGRPSRMLRHLGSFIEAHLQRRLRTPKQGIGISRVWQRKLALRAQRTKGYLTLTPSSMAYTAYQGLVVRGMTTQTIAKLLWTYQRVGGWMLHHARQHKRWHKLKIHQRHIPIR